VILNLFSILPIISIISTILFDVYYSFGLYFLFLSSTIFFALSPSISSSSSSPEASDILSVLGGEAIEGEYAEP